MHTEGELATARAAGAAGTVMCLSIMATVSLEEVAAAASGPLWLQTYIFKDREITIDLAARASLLVIMPLFSRWIRQCWVAVSAIPATNLNFRQVSRCAI